MMRERSLRGPLFCRAAQKKNFGQRSFLASLPFLKYGGLYVKKG